MKVLLVIPAYNEEDNIVRVIGKVEQFKKRQPGYELEYVIINDCSGDNTMKICTEHNYNVINLIQNLGIGGAVQTGYIYADRHGYDIAVQFDGDGQHDINSLPQLLDPVINGEKDFVVGSRFLHGQSEFKSTFLRRIGISYLSFIIKVFSRCSVNDPTSGFRAANRKAIKYLSANYPVDYPEPESLVDLSRHSFRIGEVQVNMLEREGGISSISSWKSVYYMIKVSLAIICSSLQRKVGD
ncbi:glycosyltransferase family 2 protein [[Clostridium] hylemonae]|uniref:glycosyltransferase family 2 protein n=1 Tax=[Clostridium] hylemonae TaxID=89153 RepID=UPI001FCB28BF|nr:glycosyltransferase family 2 protein [[Clostridium] hylemonae]BDF04178.1 glycosyl transferase family 2 [[Clostridium] hylemonae]